jgi:hypothetical protein
VEHHSGSRPVRARPSGTAPCAPITHRTEFAAITASLFGQQTERERAVLYFVPIKVKREARIKPEPQERENPLAAAGCLSRYPYFSAELLLCGAQAGRQRGKDSLSAPQG